MKGTLKNEYSGIIWILSSISIVIYATLAVTNKNLPGIEQLVDYISTVSGTYIFLAALLTIFIEGLYIIGNFFPGSSLVVILAVLSQAVGFGYLLLTIVAIFFGWSLSGIVNIFFAKIYHTKILNKVYNPEYQVIDRPWTTWFPTFRANYEVTQIVEGGEIYKVLSSSIKVKFLTSLVMLGAVSLLPLIIDINKLSNEEGFLSLFIIATINFIVGVVKLRKSFNN